MVFGFSLIFFSPFFRSFYLFDHFAVACEEQSDGPNLKAIETEKSIPFRNMRPITSKMSLWLFLFLSIFLD